MKAVIEGMSHGNFTGPVILVSGNGGEVGIALVDGGHAIVGWVGGLACQGSTGDWTRMERQNQWFHVAVSWYPNDEIGLFLNSVRISSCGELEKYETVNSTIAEARNIFTETATNSAYLIAKSPPLVEVGYRLAVAIVNVFDNFINPCQTPESFMGLTHAQMNHFAESSFYWPMSGLLTNLAPERLKTSSVVKARDRQHVEGAALCTDGTSKSYMILSGDGEAMSNLLNSCLYSSTKCEKLMFMIDFRFNAQLPREDKEFALVRAQASDDSVGILITVHPLNELITVVFRTPYTKCINSGNLSALEQNNEAWSYLQVYVTSGEAPMLSVNEKILAPRSQGTCHIENSSAPLSRPNITIGREVAICVSDVSIVENLNTVNPMAEVCYLETDTLLQLRGEQANHRGVPDSAFDLSSFTNRVSSKQIATCFGNSMTKCPEFTLSFWLKLNGGGTVAPSNTDHMVVSSGPGTYQGFSVSVQIVARSATFNLIVVLIMPDSIYRVFVAEFGVIGTWYNIGLVVGGTGTPAGTSVEVYRNGHAYVMTSLPVMQDPFKQFPVNPSPGLYFGSAITKMTNMSSVAIAPGVVSMFGKFDRHLFFSRSWSPQSSHKILLGKCVLNETLPTTVACQEAHYCRLSRDGVCLDATVANIYTMAKGVQLISSPDALLSLLQIVVNFLQNTSTHDDAETLRKLLWSSTTLLSHLTIVKDEPEFSKAYLRMEAFAIVGFILEFIESIFDIRFVEAWSFVNEVDPLEPNGVGTMLTVLLPELVTPNQPIIEVRRGGSFIGSYLLPANSTLWNHTYLFNSQLKIIIPSMTESSPPDSEVCVFTIATLRARYFDVEMEAMSLPKVVKWTGPSTDVWALINSPLVVTSLEENARGVLPYETKYEFTVELLQPNEYADSAFARRTDSMHWKAMAVEAKGRGELEYRVKCVLWEDARPPIAASAGQWATEECEVVQANLTHVVCSCETTGTFAVAMDYIDVVETARSFWKMAGANSWKLYDTLKLALNFSGNSLSLISLLGLTACLWFKETIVDLRDQRTIKFHLIMMLAGYQICFLLYPLVEKNEFGCRATGMLMHFFVTTFLAWNTLNNFYVFGALINGILRARLKLFVCFVWLANGVVVFAMAWATEMRDYGKRIMCLPDGATGHVMLTGVTFYLLITLIACFVLLCNTDTPAYLKPAVIEALQGELYATVNITHYCVLVYSLGFAFTHLNPPYVGFIFWTANSLLGCLVTLCFGPLGKRIAVKKRRSSDIFESGKDLATSVEAQKDAEGRPPSSASFDNFGLAEDEEVVSVEFADKSD
ncbi:unnamed protein product [Mesocestoides corti]|uniref:Uncharacterized protein n=1 Tax=Mesocestoides corti TaxID=53468 RepID=A0A3P6HKD9_MESCO|nr:unnamed protein product [Mesocestoides corti]